MEIVRDLYGLFKALPLARISGGSGGDSGLAVSGLAYNSAHVKPGYIFFCLKGNKHNGSEFIPEAIKAGAVAIVTEKEAETGDVVQILVPDVRKALSIISQQFYGSPAASLRLIGVTGTNGKTTTTHLIEALLSERGFKTGMMGTIKYLIDGETFPSLATTPEAPDLQKMLRLMVDRGVEYGVMEVSSHALELGRVDGCDFDAAIFTNITQDHLDFHKNFERYLAAKGKLFSQLGGSFFKGSGPRFAVLNSDDPYYDYFQRQSTVQTLTYGIDKPADIKAHDVRTEGAGASYRLQTPWGGESFSLQLAGRFNIYNALAATSVALLEGITLAAIKETLEKISGIDGRFERVDLGQDFMVVVDYAHTPDGLENLLRTARDLADGKIITVFGCGGEKDRGKRPLMGNIAGKYSDYSILTTDNPRGEDPWQIIKEVEAGLQNSKGSGKGYTVQPERFEAIKLGVELARPGDMVVIAGKGHEHYQIIGDSTVPFNDRLVAEEIIRQRLGSR